MSTVQEVTGFSLERVHKCLEEGKPIKALGHLLVIANLSSELKTELCPILLSVLGVISGPLAAEHRYDDLLKCYQEVLSIYSDNELVLNNIGSQLYRFNHLKESRRYFQLACSLNQNYLPAFRNLQNVTNVLVERWHFRMLNDWLRNETYMKAIRKKVVGEGNFKTVIDIGTGTGLLSLYVQAAGANYVCACDYSSVMTSIAQQVFDANLPSNAITIVNKLSSDMTVPEDVPFRCSLVVTETMDSGLLGEHLLSTLDHAWDHLLLPPAPNVGRVIPAGASLFAAPIESLKIARKNQLLPKSRLSAPPDFESLEWSTLNVQPMKTEPYDTENLYTDFGCKYLADPVEIFQFDFNDPVEVKKRLHRVVEATFKVQCKQSGVLDAVAVWFEARLDDELTITTSPLSTNACSSWHHAIFPSEPIDVACNQHVELRCKCSNGVLNVEVANSVAKKPVIYLDESVIRFLNSSSYLSVLQNTVHKLIQSNIPMNRVIDLSVFPHQGLLLSKNLASKLMAVNQIPTHFLKKVVKINKINPDLVSRKTFSDVEMHTEIEPDEKFDVLIVNFVEHRGEISQELLKATENVVNKFLKPNGFVIPHKTEIWGQLVGSIQLMNENRVTNPRLDDEFVLSKFINEYRVSTHLDITIDEVDHKPLSEPFLIGSIPTAQIYSKRNVTWEVQVPCVRDGAVNAVLYWFNTVLFDDVAFSTRSSDSFASHAAEVVDTEIPVSPFDVVCVKCIYNYGVIKLEISSS